jgi:hypothetical protein
LISWKSLRLSSQIRALSNICAEADNLAVAGGQPVAYFNETACKNKVKSESAYATMKSEIGKMKLPSQDEFLEAGGMRMAGVVAGLIVCAFVYVIRESLAHPEEEM